MGQLIGYKGQQVQAPQVQGVSTPGTQIAQQQFGSLADRLDGFAKSKFQDFERETVAQAEKDAYNDSINGEEFYSESVTTAYGRAYNNVASATFASNADLMINKRSDELLLEYENDPVSYDNNMKEFVSGLSKEAPTPELQSVISISGTKLKNNTFGKLSILENNRIKAGQVETFNQEWDLNVSQIIELRAIGNTADSDLLIGKNKEHLNAMVESGLIAPADAQKRIKETQFNTTNGVAQRDMESLLAEPTLENAEKYLQAELSQERGDMDVEENAKHQASLTRLYNTEYKSREATNGAMKKEASIAVSDAIKIYKSGKEPENYKEVIDSASLVPPKQQHELVVAESAYKIQQKIDYMTLPEQMAIVNAMEAEPGASRIDVDSLAMAKKNLSEKMTLAEKDPYSLGVQDGLYEQAGVLLPSQGSEALSQFLPIRASQSKIAQSAYGTAPKLFTDAEVQQYSAWLDNPNTSISEKIDFIETIESSVPNESELAYRQLQEKGASVFAFAGSMVKKGDRQKAEMMLKGQIILKEQPGVVPFQDMQWKLNGTIGNALRYQGAGSRQALSEASTAYYAALAEQEGKLSKESAPLALVKQAVQDVTGGVGMKNDQNYFLPPQATEDDVEDWLDELTVKDFEDVSGITPDDALDLMQRGQLISVGEGKYQVIFQGKRLMSTDGIPLIMEYTK